MMIDYSIDRTICQALSKHSINITLKFHNKLFDRYFYSHNHFTGEKTKTWRS